jgi:hypothetical protein
MRLSLERNFGWEWVEVGLGNKKRRRRFASLIKWTGVNTKELGMVLKEEP